MLRHPHPPEPTIYQVDVYRRRLAQVHEAWQRERECYLVAGRVPAWWFIGLLLGVGCCAGGVLAGLILHGPDDLSFATRLRWRSAWAACVLCLFTAGLLVVQRLRHDRGERAFRRRRAAVTLADCPRHPDPEPDEYFY